MFFPSRSFLVIGAPISSLSTSPVISGGTINNTVIGGTTAAAGSFTTLNASGNITATGDVIGSYLRSTNSIGDEGGFAPENFTVEKSLEYIKKAVVKNYALGEDVFMGMDVAAESFFDGKEYFIKEQNLKLNQQELLQFYRNC